MWCDVLDLDEFYASTLGQMTARLLRARLREIWPNVKGETVLGMGYATPLLRPFVDEAARTMAFMPLRVWANAPSAVSSRNFALRVFSSGPWHA